jgi:small subunit ribosomal protein S15
MVTKERKSAIIAEHGGKATNTGSTEAQIAMLTERINDITRHLEGQKNDKNSERGLVMLVGQRKRLLQYLHDSNLESYRALIQKLELRK